MAVYTEVSDSELEAFLADYDIGQAESFKGIAEGVENTNYVLTTTRGQYMVTLYEKRVDPRDLPFFLGLMDHLAERCDALVVIGAPNSSNSMRLVEVAANYGCAKSRLVQRAADMDWQWLGDVVRLGITAGASAPELLVDELIAACRERYDVTVEEVRTTEESVVFKLPRQLVA